MAKKTLTVTLYLSELMYDVQNRTFLAGRSRSINGNYEEAAYMQANDDEESENQILRSLGNALANLKTKLSEYISNKALASATNELLQKAANIQIELELPSNYNTSAAESIPSALHQYIVNTAIGDWFSMTNRDDAAIYFTRAATNIEELRAAINKRVRPIRNSNFV